MLWLACLIGALSVLLPLMGGIALIASSFGPPLRLAPLNPPPSMAFKLDPIDKTAADRLTSKPKVYTIVGWHDHRRQSEVPMIIAKEDPAYSPFGLSKNRWAWGQGGFGRVEALALGFEKARIACHDPENVHKFKAAPPAIPVISATSFAICMNHGAWVLGIQTEPARASVYAWRGGAMIATGAVLALVTLTLFAPTFIRFRRKRQDGCPNCGYDMTGLDPYAPCPECGHSR